MDELYDARQYFRTISQVLRGQVKMMKARGYKNINDKDLGLTDKQILSLDEVDSMTALQRCNVSKIKKFTRNKLNTIYRKDKKEIHIYYVDDYINDNSVIKKTNKDIQTDILLYVEENDVQHIIIISTVSYDEGLRMLNTDSRTIYEYFEDRQLIITPDDNILFNNPELLSRKQTQDVIDAYKINLDNLPKVIVEDPVVRYFGWGDHNIGQVIKYTNIAPFDSTIVKSWIYFRVIVPVKSVNGLL